MNFEELARSCDDFNGAQLKAVCVEAGMLALRREAEQVRLSVFYAAFDEESRVSFLWEATQQQGPGFGLCEVQQ